MGNQNFPGHRAPRIATDGRAAVWAGVAAGVGSALYAVNLYGFTALFPWFAQARDWITITAHLMFGVTAAGVYRWLERR